MINDGASVLVACRIRWSEKVLAVLCGLAALSGCSVFDSEQAQSLENRKNLSAEDYYETLSRPKPQPASAQLPDPGLPAFYPVGYLPASIGIPEARRVTLSVTEDVPLKDVLYELARKAGVNFKLDTDIKGGINFHARDQKFIDVIRNICSSAGLRYQFDGGFLRIGVDSPYFVNYNVTFLNLLRSGSSQTSISTDVFASGIGNGSSTGEGGTASAPQSSGSADNGSSSVVQSSSSGDFWGVLEANIRYMLNDAYERNDDAAQTQQPILQTEFERERLGIGTLRRTGPKSRLTINRQAGIISVFATQQEHQRIISFLNDLQRRISAQATIEAKIIEVSLNERYKDGINWQTLFENSVNFSASSRFTSPIGNVDISNIAAGEDNAFNIGINSGSFQGFLSLLQTFGTTRTLSSPRVTVINNQPAIMKVAQNQVFFQVQYERTDAIDNTPGRVNTSSKILTVPVGLVMTVQPVIDPVSQKITLAVRPTISRIQDFVNDPAVAIQSGNTVQSQIPIVEVREIDSIVNMDSGQIVLMGGLMQQNSTTDSAGIPGLRNIPVVEKLAEGRDQTTQTSELVILLKAEIADNPQAQAQDIKLYEKFIDDPRPFLF
jgi:MSHA type pilus biogenesis protein MshL